MKKIIGIITSAVALTTIGLGATCYANENSSMQNDMMQGKSQGTMMQDGMKMHDMKAHCILGTAMRKLWDDHVSYTREYIISNLANLDDKDAVAKRLLKNQDEIGAAIKPFYGSDASKKLTDLLHEHIMLAADVVNAAKTNNSDTLKQAQQKWSANADEIATFLSNANPNWSKDDLAKMLNTHLELTTGEVTSRLKKDWNADIAFYDKGHTHMMMFADYLTQGIVKQFPEKFKK